MNRAGWRNPGILAAVAAAVLFGAGTPVAKLLVAATSPWLLAGLLYLGSGVGLALWRYTRRHEPVHLTRAETGWLLGAVATGGAVGPALLMWGLASLPASGAALLLNAEGVFTALLAWFVFGESFDRRIAAGMGLIMAGALLLSWPTAPDFGAALPRLAVLGACLAWAVDNNLTRKVSLADASFIAMIKGLVAGTTNLLLALIAGASLPGPTVVLSGAALGFLSYGVSLVLFVIALRHLGAARTAAYFSTAPFVGALIALPLLNEPVTAPLLFAGALMGLGVWIHLTERHEHLHSHDPLLHAHEHAHDLHHRHEHPEPVAPGVRHSHEHRHVATAHSHGHFPDAHHGHRHTRRP